MLQSSLEISLPADGSSGSTSSDAEAGQALVEFALVGPIQLLIILFILQACHVLVSKQVLAYASHAAARAVLVGKNPHEAASLICSAISPTAPGQRLSVPGWGALPRSAGALERTRVWVIGQPGNDRGDIRVQVRHDLNLVIPIVDTLFADGRRGGGYSLELTNESQVYKMWSDLPGKEQGHPWLPDVPLEHEARQAP